MTMLTLSKLYTILDRTQISEHENDLFIGGCMDCACTSTALNVFEPSRKLFDLNQPLQKTSGLITQSLVDKEFWTVFNPVGEFGILVLNKDSLDLLEEFTDSIIVAQRQDLLGDYVLEAVQRLFDLGLISSLDDELFSSAQMNNKLLTAWLHITNQCNLGCVYCYLTKSNKHMSEETGQLAINSVIRSALDNGFSGIKLKYAGGEASLRMDTVFNLHDFAQKRCEEANLLLEAVLLTNGVNLQSCSIWELKQRKIAVMVSLDGVDTEQDLHRPFRGGQGSVSQVKRTIDRLIANELFPHLSITVTNHNAQGIAKVVEFALARNLKFSINFYRENDVASSINADLGLNEDTIISGMKAAFKAIEDNLPKWSVVGAILDRAQLISPRKHACGAGSSYMVFDHTGHVSKCHMEMNKGVADVCHPNPLEMIRLSPVGIQNLSSLEKKDCCNCEWRYFCAGGCSLATFRATGRYDVKSPNCAIYKMILPWAVQLEGRRILKFAGRHRAL
jgi:uncharacterized protein